MVSDSEDSTAELPSDVEEDEQRQEDARRGIVRAPPPPVRNPVDDAWAEYYQNAPYQNMEERHAALNRVAEQIPQYYMQQLAQYAPPLHHFDPQYALQPQVPPQMMHQMPPQMAHQFPPRLIPQPMPYLHIIGNQLVELPYPPQLMQPRFQPDENADFPAQMHQNAGNDDDVIFEREVRYASSSDSDSSDEEANNEPEGNGNPLRGVDIRIIALRLIQMHYENEIGPPPQLQMNLFQMHREIPIGPQRVPANFLEVLEIWPEMIHRFPIFPNALPGQLNPQDNQSLALGLPIANGGPEAAEEAGPADQDGVVVRADHDYGFGLVVDAGLAGKADEVVVDHGADQEQQDNRFQRMLEAQAVVNNADPAADNNGEAAGENHRGAAVAAVEVNAPRRSTRTRRPVKFFE
ncbi:hypothetical protein CAEBREN_10271 [Caenorhabditis brenneri]|uniref:Uncharacterized protein n=1 Tax=Caenorhabditis brenneri TaxID=135651 RepID=G0MW46_CAEBE|nr:hypothetical protein CAEBREN_10271 [Caenorhabditis brenneri]